ncbi:acyclic terpene utilization AtuA family protein [Microvirga vignae]|nr:acyclic terpene utilization AtuA family protein [Microvirga vignae]
MISTSGLLGYGFPEASLKAGLQRDPHLIGVDGGSTDPGPYYLGSGKTLNSRFAMKRDIALMLRGALAHRIPLVIGSCGGAGGAPHLATVVEIVRELAREEGHHFKMAVIQSELQKDTVLRFFEGGNMRPLRNAPDITAESIARATRVVGMMGPEPYMRALDNGAQVILGGRTSDPAPWAGAAIRAGLPPAPSWYAGKMLECGATPSLPKGHDCLIVTVRDDSVEAEPLNPIRRCTPLSVANHSLHENSSPCVHVEPGGILDTTDCVFEAVNDRAVRISGMSWRSMPYTVKLEGTELVGFRAMTICGTRDPMLIGRFDEFLDSVRKAVDEKVGGFGLTPDKYRLVFRVYGKSGVMGEMEPVKSINSHELGILVEALADTQEIANAVLAFARVSLLHTDFPGRLCREGNMAFPFSPSDVEMEPLYRFNIFHTVTPKDPCELFPIEYEVI